MIRAWEQKQEDEIRIQIRVLCNQAPFTMNESRQVLIRNLALESFTDLLRHHDRLRHMDKRVVASLAVQLASHKNALPLVASYLLNKFDAPEIRNYEAIYDQAQDVLSYTTALEKINDFIHTKAPRRIRSNKKSITQIGVIARRIWINFHKRGGFKSTALWNFRYEHVAAILEVALQQMNVREYDVVRVLGIENVSSYSKMMAHTHISNFCAHTDWSKEVNWKEGTGVKDRQVSGIRARRRLDDEETDWGG
jgi:hypothetical protein